MSHPEQRHEFHSFLVSYCFLTPFESPRRDLNPRPSVYETDALAELSYKGNYFFVILLMFKSFLSYPKSCSLCCADLGIVQFLLEKLALFKNCIAIFVLSEISCEISILLVLKRQAQAGSYAVEQNRTQIKNDVSLANVES